MADTRKLLDLGYVGQPLVVIEPWDDGRSLITITIGTISINMSNYTLEALYKAFKEAT